jgi:hypothetical protein
VVVVGATVVVVGTSVVVVVFDELAADERVAVEGPLVVAWTIPKVTPPK